MDGLQGVQARVAEIQSLMMPRPTPVARSTGTETTTFSAALEAATTAVSGAPVGVPTAAQRLAPGEYGRLEPPAELTQYGNGQIPADALTPIGIGSHRLYQPAAEAFVRMRSDAAAAGVDIGITDSYRSYDQQVRLAEEKGLYSNGGLAATPGRSNHGWGLATDLDLDDTAQQWMRDNGWKYGFVEDTPREPWHWAYRPAAIV